MKVVIAGGRDFTNADLAYNCIDKLVHEGDIIISGHANGADTIGEHYVIDHHLQYELYPANWTKYGQSAGPIRNEQMAKIADKVIVFWNGKSHGTKNMIAQAKKYKCKLFIFNYCGELLEAYE